MGGIVRFTRNRRKRRRRPLPMVLPWIILLGLAAAVYVMSERRTTTGVAGHDNFQLCGWVFRHNCVIDGDTIRHGGVKIRLEDIDAPEISDPKCASEAALGQRAKHRLLELMNAGPFEVVRTGGRDEDIYGRKLRVIARNGRSVGKVLVAEGLARPWNGGRRSWCR